MTARDLESKDYRRSQTAAARKPLVRRSCVAIGFDN